MIRLRRLSVLILFSLMTILFIQAASAESFAQDLNAIDKAAGSVLMLNVYDEKNNVFATGSGIVAFDNKTLVTNFHVIRDAEWIMGVSDAGYQYLITKVIAADEKRDIALLEFYSPTDLMPLELMAGQDLKRAAPVVAIGSPQGVKNTVSLGNISAVYEEEDVHYIQFTAPISHGSSGGALFDDTGRVIGITTMYFYDSQNMNLAVDIGEVVRLKEAGFQNERVTFAGQRQRSRQPATPTPIPLSVLMVTPAPDLTNAPTFTPEQAPEPSATAKLNTELQVMTTQDGVILRWEKSPDTLYYEIYRGKGNDGMQMIGSVAPGEAYYIDTDAQADVTRCKYMVSAVLNGSPKKTVKTWLAYSDPVYTLDTAIPKPYGLIAQMGEYALELTWKCEKGANSYNVYRAVSEQGPFNQIWRTEDKSFIDHGAVPGNVYYYQIKAVVDEKAISQPSLAAFIKIPESMPTRTPPADASDPKYPLSIGEDGFVDTYLGYPRMLPSLINDSAYRTITGFQLVYYCWDKDKQPMPQKDTREVYYTQWFDVAIGPSESIYPTYAWLYGYPNAVYVNVAVASITFADGMTVDIPESEWKFFYWSIQ